MYTLYTDGGARGNPGPAGAGAVIFDRNLKKIAEAQKFLGVQTNNWSEYEAVIIGLERLKEIVPASELPSTKVLVRLDSQLVQRQLMGEYRVKDPELYKQYLKIKNILTTTFPNTVFEHVRREQNTEADKLANQAMDKGQR